MLTQEEYGFSETGPLMAKRELTTIDNLVKSTQFETSKSLDLMKNLRKFSDVYRGNQEVINGLLIMNACATDIRKELEDDLKLFGGGHTNAE